MTFATYVKATDEINLPGSAIIFISSNPYSLIAERITFPNSSIDTCWVNPPTISIILGLYPNFLALSNVSLVILNPFLNSCELWAAEPIWKWVPAKFNPCLWIQLSTISISSSSAPNLPPNVYSTVGSFDWYLINIFKSLTLSLIWEIF